MHVFSTPGAKLPKLPKLGNQSNQIKPLYCAPKVDQRAGQLSLPHIGITKSDKNRTRT